MCCGYPTVAHFLVMAPKRLGRVRDTTHVPALFRGWVQSSFNIRHGSI